MRLRALTRPLAVLALCVAASAPALAQPKSPPVPVAPSVSAPIEPADGAPDSPRAAVKRYLELCRAGEYAEAASYLDLPEADKARGPLLARRLKAVLDRQVWVKLEALSPKSAGKLDDRLPVGVEEIGTIPGPNGPEPVRLVRRHSSEGGRWLFSRATVERIDGWHERLADKWAEDHLPEVLLRPGPHELLVWQWIALPILFGLAVLAGKVLAYFTRLSLGRLVTRTKTTLDDALLARLRGPLTLVWALAVVDVALPRLVLNPTAHAFSERLLRAGYFVALFWFVTRSIDVVAAHLLELPRTRDNPAARSLVPLCGRAAQVAIVGLSFIAVVSELGYPVGSLVAGLGIGGIALALAAQKTVENLFGSLSIGVDQPFRVGDFVIVDGVSGTVESIGLRSTRIRTLDRTVVTLPNGKLADMRVESFAARDRIRLYCMLSLAPGTRPAVVRRVLAGLRSMFKADPKATPQSNASLSRLTENAVDIEIVAFCDSRSWDVFLAWREETLLSVLEVVEKAGAALAVPTRELRFESSRSTSLGAQPLPPSGHDDLR